MPQLHTADQLMAPRGRATEHYLSQDIIHERHNLFLFCVCLRNIVLQLCGHLLGTGWLLGSPKCDAFSLSRTVSWVRYVTWLYRFLIFVLFPTLFDFGNPWISVQHKHRIYIYTAVSSLKLVLWGSRDRLIAWDGLTGTSDIIDT